MYLYLAIGISILLLVWTIGSYVAISNIEEPTYTVLENHDSYEIREYAPYIIAEAEVSGNYNEASRAGFRLIADYIFGNNTSQSSIAMTTPVLQKQSEKIAMTIPVITNFSDSENQKVSFVLPSEYTIDTLPTPNNSQVMIVEVPSYTAAVRRFSWYTTAERVQKQINSLLQVLDRDDKVAISSPSVARYNPPLSMPLILRNEIIIQVDQSI